MITCTQLLLPSVNKLIPRVLSQIFSGLNKFIEKYNNIYDTWKCNQALIVGFGDNDHTIKELMRFIEMTSREFIFEDVTQNGGAPNYKYR